MRFLALALTALTAATVGQALAQDNGEGGAVSLVSDQIILIATVVGAVATLPTLIEFLIDRRKRKERIALSLDDLAVADLDVRLAGLDALLADIVDLIDRAKHPEAYASLKIGNEILIIGPAASGKKTLAQRIAKDAGMDRLIIVYNARNADALTSAKSLLQRYRRHKVMLLLPRLDNVVEDEDEEILAELDALIETTTERSNVQVVGTAVGFEPGGLLDNMFGIVLALPGTPVKHAREHSIPDDARRMRLMPNPAQWQLVGSWSTKAFIEVVSAGAPQGMPRQIWNSGGSASSPSFTICLANQRWPVSKTSSSGFTPSSRIRLAPSRRYFGVEM